MVEVEGIHLMSDEGPTRGTFPDQSFNEIIAAVESVSESVLTQRDQGDEAKQLDSEVAERLPGYAFDESGANADVKLWEDAGHRFRLDLYNPNEKIAIEIEKSEQKYIWKDIMKFAVGGVEDTNGDVRIEYGCLILPTKYSGGRNPYKRGKTILEFAEPIISIGDIALVGYRNPRWE